MRRLTARPSLLLTLTLLTGVVAVAPIAPAPVSAGPNDHCVATHQRSTLYLSQKAIRISTVGGQYLGATHGAMAVSPDGTQVLFAAGTPSTGGVKLYVSRLDGSDAKAVYTFPGSSSGIHGNQYRWSANGRYVAFTDGFTQNERLFIVDTATGTLTFTSAFQVTLDQYDFSPDSTKLVYVDDRPVFPREVWVVNSDGSGNTRILTNNSSDAALPPWVPPKSITDVRWSPDGTRIAFTGRIGNDGANVSRIYVMNANGSGIVDVGTDAQPRVRFNPAWSPDGTRIAFSWTYNQLVNSQIQTFSGVSVVNLSGGGPTIIPNTQGYESYISGRMEWSNDGPTLLMAGSKRASTSATLTEHGVFAIPIGGASPIVNLEPHEGQPGLETALVGLIRCDAILAGVYGSLNPARLLDTRADGQTVDNSFRALGIAPAGSTIELLVAGRGGVPADATAVALNVAVTGSLAPGFITAYPCGSNRPNAANLNYSTGETIPNLVISRIGEGGKVCLFTLAATHIIADVNGAFGPGPAYSPLVPARLLESRSGLATIDGQFNNIGIRPAGSVTELVVAGRGNVPANASAVVLNVAVTDAQAPGFITAYPCGSERPTAANLNYSAGDTIPNLVIAKVGVGGKVCLFTLATTHIIADVNGAFGAGSSYKSLVPARLYESRSGLSTVDGSANGQGKSAAGQVVQLTVTGRGGVPVDASAVVLNIAVTEPEAPGFITVYPCGSERPNAANLNYSAGDTIPNLVIAKVGVNGRVCIFTLARTHLVVDVNGAFPTL